MKLKEIAYKAIELIKNARDEGILNSDLASRILVPRRRVYDIIAILQSSGLIKIRRESGGTRIYWQGKELSTERKLIKMMEVNSQLKREIHGLELKVATLKNRVKELETQPIIGETRPTIQRIRMEHPIVRVIAESPGQVKRFHMDGLGVVIETTSKSIIVEPVIRKTKLPWESDQTVFTTLPK
ncbi:MAG: hypothetical protein ACTSYO_05785 [Candidatus Ranarchaeia archaeon]